MSVNGLPSSVTAGLIEAVLQEVLSPTALHVRDDSHLHAGHAGAREGGHYFVMIKAESFKGLSKVACHRLVYDALRELIPRGIHALSIQAEFP